MNITLEPMLGALFGGWEVLLIILSMVSWLVIVGGIIAIVLVLSKSRNGKQQAALPTVEKPPVVPWTETMPVNCPQCGTPLPSGALAGLCPACLLKMGAAADTVKDAKQKTFTPPDIAELAAKFPQLEILELIGKGGMGAVYSISY
jgi:hypothetical protein